MHTATVNLAKEPPMADAKPSEEYKKRERKDKPPYQACEPETACALVNSFTRPLYEQFLGVTFTLTG